MQINESIFRSYDIRGIYPSELNEDVAYLIGRAFAMRSGAKRITVGSDARISGPALKKALIKGITDEGANVKDIGLMPIDAIYFSVGKLGDEAGIMITASHNPKEHNGFKMVAKNMQWIRGEELLEDVKSLSRLPEGNRGSSTESGPAEIAKEKGQVEEDDIIAPYINHVLSFIDIEKIKPLKVVADAGNGIAGKIIPILTQGLPLNIVPLNFKLDGNFPAHPSNPLLEESQKEICETVVKEKADFGVIFDGDTDRLIFIDEKGKSIPADMTLLLLAKLFLEREPGAGIVYNVICSKAVPEFIKEWGGRPLRAKVGFINLMIMMKEQNGIMSGELSSHYAFRDNCYADSGFITLALILQLLSNHEQPLSEIVKPFFKYFKAAEANFEVADKAAVIEKIKEKYSDGNQDFLDGITVEYKDWWFNVRPSNTESLLRLTVEADAQELLSEKSREIKDFISRGSSIN